MTDDLATIVKWLDENDPLVVRSLLQLRRHGFGTIKLTVSNRTIVKCEPTLLLKTNGQEKLVE